jgi:multicomponent Na+:H+ antiporter subunit F
MIATAFSPISLAAHAGVTILSLAVLLCVVRLWRGPSLPDRILALDTLSILLVGLLVLDTITTREMHSLRVAIVLALVNFVGTIGFSLYLRRRVAA